jgi:hypothetical protein
VIPYVSLGAAFRPNTTLALGAGGGAATVSPAFPEVGNGADLPYMALCYDVVSTTIHAHPRVFQATLKRFFCRIGCVNKFID